VLSVLLLFTDPDYPFGIFKLFLQQICSVCRNHNPVLSLFMTFHWVYNKSNLTGATSEAEIAYLFWNT